MSVIVACIQRRLEVEGGKGQHLQVGCAHRPLTSSTPLRDTQLHPAVVPDTQHSKHLTHISIDTRIPTTNMSAETESFRRPAGATGEVGRIEGKCNCGAVQVFVDEPAFQGAVHVLCRECQVTSRVVGRHLTSRLGSPELRIQTANRAGLPVEPCEYTSGRALTL